MPVTKTADNSASLKQAVAYLLKSVVVVGIPDSTAERQPEPGEKAPPSNAIIGYWQEFGVPEKNIPARPFLLPGCESVKDAVAMRLAKAGEAALTGNASAVEAGLTAVGMIAASAVQAKITDSPFAPLAQSTIEARARRGQAGAKSYIKLQGQGTPDAVLQDAALVRPLIDSGQLRRAITSVVRSR